MFIPPTFRPPHPFSQIYFSQFNFPLASFHWKAFMLWTHQQKNKWHHVIYESTSFKVYKMLCTVEEKRELTWKTQFCKLICTTCDDMWVYMKKHFLFNSDCSASFFALITCHFFLSILKAPIIYNRIKSNAFMGVCAYTAINCEEKFLISY